MYSIWDENRNVTGYERAILERSNLPEYQWIEAGLVPEDVDDGSYARLAKIRAQLSDFYCIQKNNVVICGKNLGCGKTSWAVKLLLTHIENNAPRLRGKEDWEIDSEFNVALFIPTVPFLVDIKQFNDNRQASEIYQKAKTAQLVVFDDVGAVNMSKYDYNVLYAIIEMRVLNHLPSIFTTNCVSEDELKEALGPRLADRIWNTSKIIELKGRGFRGV